MLNKVTLIGNLGADPKLKEFSNGSSCATVRLATTRKWTDKATNEKKTETEWHNVVFNDGLAKTVMTYLTSGSKIYVEGKIKYETWNDKTTGLEKNRTVIRASELIMLGKNPETKSSESHDHVEVDFEEDVPF